MCLKIIADATSTIRLGSEFTKADLGTLDVQPNTAMHIVGALDLTGDSLNFSSLPGSWRIKGGEVLGGEIFQSVGNELVLELSGQLTCKGGRVRVAQVTEVVAIG